MHIANVKVKKDKFQPITGHEDPERESRCGATLYLTSELDGLGGEHYVEAALPLGMTRYPLHRRLGGPQGSSGQESKIALPLGFDPWTIQPVRSRYTTWATMAQLPTYNLHNSWHNCLAAPIILKWFCLQDVEIIGNDCVCGRIGCCLAVLIVKHLKIIQLLFSLWCFMNGRLERKKKFILFHYKAIRNYVEHTGNTVRITEDKSWPVGVPVKAQS
jgi:hypothetical protein